MMMNKEAVWDEFKKPWPESIECSFWLSNTHPPPGVKGNTRLITISKHFTASTFYKKSVKSIQDQIISMYSYSEKWHYFKLWGFRDKGECPNVCTMDSAALPK